MQVCEPCASLHFAKMGALDALFEIVRFGITALVTVRSTAANALFCSVCHQRHISRRSKAPAVSRKSITTGFLLRELVYLPYHYKPVTSTKFTKNVTAPPRR
jgi:hypothetical protein